MIVVYLEYGRHVIPARRDVVYSHQFLPAVYLASLQLLSTLRCVVWEVYEDLMERHGSIAWFSVRRWYRWYDRWYY